MTTAQHTPGPWAQADGDDMEIVADVGAVICTVMTAYHFPCVDDADVPAVERECEANARLIAAAPEMLAALEAIERAPAWGAPERWDTTPAEVRLLARAAITKARGGAASAALPAAQPKEINP